MIYIIAEGKTDIALIQYILYINHKISSCIDINKQSNKPSEYQVSDNIILVNLEGQNNLENYISNTISAELEKENITKMLIINDADNDYDSAKKCINDIMNKNNIDENLFEIFILPNNQDNGILEDLLLECANDTYKPLIDCYIKYKDCLKNNNIPNYEKDKRKDILKDEVFVYTIHFKCKPEKSYDKDTNLWNINHENLKPLINFITTNI